MQYKPAMCPWHEGEQSGRQVNSILGFIRRESAASRSRKLILLLSSALLRPHLKFWVQFWTPQHERATEVLERV